MLNFKYGLHGSLPEYSLATQGTIFVTADEKIRLERLMKRNSFTIEVAQKRINAQKANGKQEKSDYVIENNGDINALDGQVDEILDLILIG